MGADVYAASPAARAVFDAADAASGLAISKLCFEGPEEELRTTEVQQPAILTVSVALLRALEEQTSVVPAFVAGHSLGEYTALVASGAVSFEDALRLVGIRARLMQEAVPEGQGGMAAVMGCDADVVDRACEQARQQTGAVVSTANYNSPQQNVISGEVAAVELASARAREGGARKIIALPVSAPFHCALMESAADKLAAELARVAFADPQPPVVSNVDAAPNREGARIAQLLFAQVTSPVRFQAMVERMSALGVTGVLEIGPGRVLSGLVARTVRSLRRANLASVEDMSEAARFVGEFRSPGSQAESR